MTSYPQSVDAYRTRLGSLVAQVTRARQVAMLAVAGASCS
jgi:hypothetical protein